MSISFMRTNHECFWKNSRAIVPVYPTSQSFASSGYWRHIGPGSFCSRRSALVFLNMFLLASNPLEILQIVSFIVNIYGFPWISMIMVARNTQRMLQQTHHHWWFGHISLAMFSLENCSCGTRPCSWCLPSAHCHFLKGWRSWRSMQRHHQWPPLTQWPTSTRHCFTKSLELDLPRNDRHLRRLPKRKAVSRRLQLEAFLHLPTAKPGRSKAHSSKLKAEPTNHFFELSTLVLVGSSLHYPSFFQSPKTAPPLAEATPPSKAKVLRHWSHHPDGVAHVGLFAGDLEENLRRDGDRRRHGEASRSVACGMVRNGWEGFIGKAKGKIREGLGMIRECLMIVWNWNLFLGWEIHKNCDRTGLGDLEPWHL